METQRDSDAVLQGEGFLLRPWDVKDASWYVEARDKEVFKWTTERRDLTVAEAEEGIRLAASNPDAVGFAIVDAPSGDRLGSICLVFDDGNRDVAEVMYWLAPCERGRGIATSALKVLCSWAFRSLGLRRITLKTLVGNTRSQRLAERAGFRILEVEDGERSDASYLWFELTDGG